MKERNKIMRFFGLHPQNDVRGRFAFTLAEVLVTLGIIGVVAVLTVPNVISSYQKKVYVTQLQKGYSQLQQVFDLAMADDEVEYIADTELMQSINGDHIGARDDQSAFSSKLGEYMKIQKACQPRDFSEGCHDIYYFDFSETGGAIEEGYSKAGSNRGGSLQVFTKDGMIYYFPMFFDKYPSVLSDEQCEEIKADGGSVCSFHTVSNGAGLEIDVNGKKKPNKYGRDMFRFSLDDKGQVYLGGSASFFGNSDSYNEHDWFMCDKDSVYGLGCAAKIMDAGWVMDY